MYWFCKYFNENLGLQLFCPVPNFIVTGAIYFVIPQLDYDPVVDVRAIKPKNKGKSDIKSAIDETAKYPVKDTDFMTDDEERNLQRLADLEEGLYRKRLISYGGLLKEIHKELNLDDAEDGDLIHTDDEEKADEDGFSIIAMWNWERKNYFIKE
ncbi:protein rep [Proteus mirabilis]